MNKFDDLIQAINERITVSFQYHNKRRIVIPFALGNSKAENLVLRAKQLEVDHAPADPKEIPQLFLVDEMFDVFLTDHSFDDTQLRYKKGDLGMTRIFAEL